MWSLSLSRCRKSSPCCLMVFSLKSICRGFSSIRCNVQYTYNYMYVEKKECPNKMLALINTVAWLGLYIYRRILVILNQCFISAECFKHCKSYLYFKRINSLVSMFYFYKNVYIVNLTWYFE